jgi:O-antigen ligase
MKDGFKFFVVSPRRERQIFLFLVSGIAFSVPFRAIYNSLFCIALLLFWLLFMSKKIEVARIRIIGAASTLFLIALAGMLYTQNIDEGLFRLQQKSLLLILPLVVGTITLEWQPDLKRILSVFVVAIVVASLACLLAAFVFYLQQGSTAHFFSHGLLEFDWVDLYPYILAILCLVAVLVLAEAMLGRLELHPFLLMPGVTIVLIFFLSVFIFLLSVKQIILAFLIFVVVYAVRLNRKLSLALLVASVAIFSASAFLIPTLKARIHEVILEQEKENPLDLEPEKATPLNGVALRRALWVCAIDAIKSNPLLGVGTGDGQDSLQAAYAKREFFLASKYNRFNAHNQYLQTLVNFGILGLMVWLTSLVWLVRKFRNNWVLLCVLSLLLFAMLTESMLETNKGAVVMSFLFTTFCFGGRSKSGTVTHAK